ncbi:hypothetical protein ScPMuIL_000423 [Solemya velum]
MTQKIDKNSIRDAYHDVRDDSSETNWAVLKYNVNMIVLDSTGSDFDEFKTKFSDEERVFAFLRVITGDELSKRSKFALITWIGQNVPAIKRAKSSIDKSAVKDIIQSFAVELQINAPEELQEEFIQEQVRRAGGANYGVGHR